MNQAINLPKCVYSGVWNSGHCQGIAVDTNKKYIYYAFTTTLVKTDLEGNLIGSVTGLLGHLGCIDFCDGDGRLYGSLEYKNDVIGKGILAHLGKLLPQDVFSYSGYSLISVPSLNVYRMSFLEYTVT